MNLILNFKVEDVFNTGRPSDRVKTTPGINPDEHPRTILNVKPLHKDICVSRIIFEGKCKVEKGDKIYAIINDDLGYKLSCNYRPPFTSSYGQNVFDLIDNSLTPLPEEERISELSDLTRKAFKVLEALEIAAEIGVYNSDEIRLAPLVFDYESAKKKTKAIYESSIDKPSALITINNEELLKEVNNIHR